MRSILNFVIKTVVLFGGLWCLLYLINPSIASKIIIPLVPKKYMEPIMRDSMYVHNESKFLEELKLIHGEFVIQDTCIYGFDQMFSDDIANLMVTTKGKINFYVNIDTSMIQINNNSKTFLIDTSNIKLQYFISDYKIDHVVNGQLVISDYQVNKGLSQCNEYFNTSVTTSAQLKAAKKSLNRLIETQFIFLIQKGYHENKFPTN